MGKEREKRFQKESGGEILRFALPLAGSEFFIQLYSLIYTMILSQGLGISAIAALGACGAYTAMQSFIANGMTTGFGIYLSRCYGQENERQYRSCFSASMYLNGGLILFSVLLAVNVEPLLELIRVQIQLRSACRLYLQMLLLGTGALGFKNLMIHMVRGTGDAVVSGAVTILGIAVQIILLPTLIFALHVGIAAAPLTVLLNNILIGSVLLIYMKRKYREWIGFENPIQIPKEIWKELLANGFSKSGMMVLVGIGGFFMQHAKNVLPEAMIAGSALADTLSNFFLVPISALAQTASVAAGQNMGRGEFENIGRYNRKILGYHLGCSILAVAASWLGGTFLLRLLVGPTADEEVISAGSLWLSICIPAFTGLGAAMICRNSLQAMGSYRKLLYLGIQEMAVTVLFAQEGVPRFGYPALCASIAVKWMLLGATAVFWYRQRLKSLSETGNKEKGNGI